MYLITPPLLIRWLNPDVIWRIYNTNNTIYLTFDDGPTPGITNRVLDLLDRYNAKATFFCTGNNVKQNPELFESIKLKGHGIGNHTLDHPKTDSMPLDEFMSNVQDAEKLIQSQLFRPPYGRFNYKIKKALTQAGYKMVMWDLLCGDFDASLSQEQVYKNIIKNIRPGSIILMHDSQKAYPRNLYALQRLLEDFNDKFVFSKITV
jgi:peptidoglycan-N-acetylglucosamine deacetylase